MNCKKIYFQRITIAVLMSTLVLFAQASMLAFATEPGSHGGTVADNNFGPNDLGKPTREEDKNKNGKPDYEDNNPNEGERNYQTHGSANFNHDGIGGHDTNNNGVRDGGEQPFDRGDIASMAARYQGPKNGYEEVNAPAPCQGKITVPKAGGANYSADFPITAPQGPIDHKKVIKNIKKFVHDFLQPACFPPPGQGNVSDEKIIEDFNKGNLDIGKRHPPQDVPNYVCCNQASFLCSLMRELGYPCREKWVSLTRNKLHKYPEAASNVWYNGKWHLEDPFLQVNEKPENYKDRSITDVRIWQSREGPWDTGPGPDPDKPTTPPDETAMRSGVLLEENNEFALIYVTDIDGNITGEITTTGDNVVVDNLLTTLDGTENQIPFSWYSPHGLPIFSIWDDNASFIGYTLEHLFLGFSSFNTPSDDVGTRSYEICVHTESSISQEQEFEVLLTSIETNRIISVSPSLFEGTVFPGEIVCFDFSVTVGDPICDIDMDGDVDRDDIYAIFESRNTEPMAGDRRDADGDGVITVNDARICVLECTNPQCTP